MHRLFRRATALEQRTAREGGFTLIELLVVIIILGILAAVVVFAVGGVGDKGKAAAEAIDTRTLRTAEEAYFAQNGRYGTEAELVAGGLLSEESSTNKVYLNSAAGSCPAGSKCDYSIGNSSEGSSLVLYSGRSATLVNPLLTQFTADTGINLTTNFTGGSSGLAALLLTEGANTPADVFFSQDAGTLGQVSRAGLFKTAPAGATGRIVNPKFLAQDRTWAGVSGRVRVIAYNPTKVPAASVPTNVFDLTGPAWTGKVGYDPTNASFQNFVAAMVLTNGQAATSAWLTAFKNNSPVRITGNLAIAQAVANAASPVQLGLINHYYRFQLTPAEQANVVNSYTTGGDPGALVNTAGAGILKNTDSPGAAEMFVKYLVSKSAQTYFRDQTSEYPLVADVAARPELIPLAQVQSPNIDLNALDNALAVSLLTTATLLP
ncbi:MAG: extracellular solute-binding protein [Acidimicrobiales bacterium]